MRVAFLLVIAVVCTSSLFAQTGNISGRITDSSGKRPLPLTTITIFIAKDTTIVTYRLTTETGEFKVPGLPMGVPLRLLATYSGYEGYRKDFTLSAEKPMINFGTLKMVNTSKQLDEVIVVAERPPVMIKKDTIEFNASAFKTLPNALVEDLLKKLPGVQVDANGDITVNGQKVNRILVNNKRFFGDDPKMATRNLPSNFIDKVQVMDDKDQIAQNNDGDMSNIGKVINLTLKKEVKKGWFGKLSGGAGTDSRYDASAIANIFRDTLQVNLIGYANNVNRPAFSLNDIVSLGGFSRSGVSTVAVGSNGTASINGLSFGGSSVGSGITTSDGAGFNLNHAPTKNLSFYAQYFYGHGRNDLVSTGNVERFISDTIINTRTNTQSVNFTNSHNANIGGNWRVDSLTNINLRVGFVHSDNNLNAPTLIAIDNNKLGALSNANGVLYSKANSDAFSETFSITHKFRGKRLRNLSVYESLDHTTNPNYNTTESLNQYYYPTTSNQVFSQLRSTQSPSTNFYGNAAYSDVLSKKVTLRINNTVEYIKQAQDVFTYGKHAAGNQYDSLNYALSNSLEREQTRWGLSTTIGYKLSKIVTLNIGGRWLQQWINNSFGVGGLNSSKLYYSDLLPVMSLQWKRFTASLSQDVTAPSINYLIPVPDNSNPYNILYGNGNLRPAKRTSLTFNGSVNNPKTSTTLFGYFNAGFTENAVAQYVTVNSNGVQTNTPVNVNDVFSSNLSVSVNKQYKNKQKFIFAIDTRVSASLNKNPIFFNGVQSSATVSSFSTQLGLSFNWHDAVEFNPRYSPVFNFSRYSNPAFYNSDVVTQNLSGEFIVRLPKHVVWETSVNYRYNNQVAPGLPKDNVYWTAAVSLLMLKDERGQLKLAVYDILNSNNSYTRFISANSITESRTNVLQRYASLTFIYNVRAMGAAKQKVGGRQSIFMF